MYKLKKDMAFLPETVPHMFDIVALSIYFIRVELQYHTQSNGGFGAVSGKKTFFNLILDNMGY